MTASPGAAEPRSPPSSSSELDAVAPVWWGRGAWGPRPPAALPAVASQGRPPAPSGASTAAPRRAGTLARRPVANALSLALTGMNALQLQNLATLAAAAAAAQTSATTTNANPLSTTSSALGALTSPGKSPGKRGAQGCTRPGPGFADLAFICKEPESGRACVSSPRIKRRRGSVRAPPFSHMHICHKRAGHEASAPRAPPSPGHAFFSCHFFLF